MRERVRQLLHLWVDISRDSSVSGPTWCSALQLPLLHVLPPPEEPLPLLARQGEPDSARGRKRKRRRRGEVCRTWTRLEASVLLCGGIVWGRRPGLAQPPLCERKQNIWTVTAPSHPRSQDTHIHTLVKSLRVRLLSSSYNTSM